MTNNTKSSQEKDKKSSTSFAKFISLFLFAIALLVHFYTANLGIPSYEGFAYKFGHFIAILPTLLIEVAVIAYIFYRLFLPDKGKKKNILGKRIEMSNKWFYFLIFSVVAILWGFVPIVFPILT